MGIGRGISQDHEGSRNKEKVGKEGSTKKIPALLENLALCTPLPPWVSKTINLAII